MFFNAANRVMYRTRQSPMDRRHAAYLDLTLPSRPNRNTMPRRRAVAWTHTFCRSSARQNRGRCSNRARQPMPRNTTANAGGNAIERNARTAGSKHSTHCARHTTEKLSINTTDEMNGNHSENEPPSTARLNAQRRQAERDRCCPHPPEDRVTALSKGFGDFIEFCRGCMRVVYLD